MAMRSISFDGHGGEWLANESLRKQLDSTDNSQQLERLRTHLARARAELLTPRQQRLVTLYYDQGMTMGQIAVKLGIHVSTVSRTLKRARRRLYSYLRLML